MKQNTHIDEPATITEESLSVQDELVSMTAESLSMSEEAMLPTQLINNENQHFDELTVMTAEYLSIQKEAMLPFADSFRFVKKLLSSSLNNSKRIVSIGPLTDSMLSSITKSETTHYEIVGIHPYCLETDQIITDLEKTDTVYLANPNHLNGSAFSLGELEQIASAVSKGLLIVDEYYYDFFGISALSLLDKFTNIIIIRSFTAASGYHSSDAGYIVSSSETIRLMKEEDIDSDLSPLLFKTIFALIKNKDVCLKKFYEIHSETLKAAIDLNRLGAQCRITPADYILIQVSNPKKVSECLTRAKIPFEINKRYSSLSNQIKYRFESSFEYSRLINAFNSMPSDYYRMIPMDSRHLTLKRKSEESVKNVENLMESELEPAL